MEENSSFEDSRARGPFMGVTGVRTHQPIRKVHSGRDSTVGILRLDIGKPRRSSGSSVEFLSPFDRYQAEPPSPQPSVDRLSVTFAPEERSVCSDSSVKVNVFSTSLSPQTTNTVMEKVHFSREPTVTDGEEEEDDDYSASVSAIMQRRASVRRPSRRRSRRPSSPFSPDADSGQSGARRRSSVFTTSSGDTGISMEEGTTQEQIYENLRLHKEVLSSVKQQPWNMRRKLRLVQQAKAYVRRHEGELQERLAQSKTTKDVLARFNILRVKLWQYLKRELANLTNVLIPWELRIKEIESHFGSVVASYFTFLRWLFWVNLVLAVLLSLFVIMPEMLTADRKSGGELKAMLPEEVDKSTNLITLWNFEGVLKYSPIFYGYYTNRDDTNKGYRLPFAYFMTGLAVYIYSFVATLRRMAENSRMSKLSEKDDECVFTWKLLSGWDYMIGNAETAHNRVASIILGFKEALLEEAEKKKDARNWKVIACRVLVNFTVLILLASSAYAVVEVVNRSKHADETWWRQNEITVVLSLISFVFPLLFEALGLMESYHPRKQLRIQLARIMVLNLLNLYTLIFALFGKINDMTIQLQLLKNSTAVPESSTRASFTPEGSFTRGVNVVTAAFLATSDMSASSSQCFDVQVPCGAMTSTPSPPINITTTLVAALLFANVTSNTIDSSSFANITSLFVNSSLATSTTSFLGLINNSSFDLPSTLSMTRDELLTFLNMSTITSNYTESTTYEGFEEATNQNADDRFDFSNISTSPFITYPTSEDITSDYLNDSLVNVTTSGGDDEWNATLFTETYDISSKDITDTTTETSTEVDVNSTLTAYLTTITNHIRSQSSDVTEDDMRAFLNEVMTVLSSSSEAEEEEEVCYERRCTDYTQEYTTDPVTSQQTEDPNGTSYTGSGSGGSSSSSDDAYLQRAMPVTSVVDIETRRKLRNLCWETMFGQELVKLTVFDLVITIFSTLLVDFFRAIFVRVMNNCWCWDLEKQFPQYGDFKIAENILHLVNNQGMVWMGMFFSPALPLLNLVKLGILMYLRSWAVLTCNVPHEIVFRASRSNNFYFALLLTMLFLCVLPVGYAVVWVEPSWHCGPFSNYERIYHMFTQSLYKFMPPYLHRGLDYIASPGIVIPLLMLLVLIIYYLISLTGALREANNDLKTQLRRERTEERRKMFQLVDRRRRKGSGIDSTDTPFARWRKILPVLPSHKTQMGDEGNCIDGKDADAAVNGTLKPDSNRNEMLARLMKRALRKSSATSDEESVLIGDGDGTDVEQHDSLPDDTVLARLAKTKIRMQNVVEAAKNQSEPSKKGNDKNVRKNVESSHKTNDPTQKNGDAQKSKSEPQRKNGEQSGKKVESSKKNDEPAKKKASEPILITDSSMKKRADHPRHHYSSHNRRASTRSKSPSTSSIKERGEDSQNSNWSDNIPVIRISKTDSADFDLHMRAEPQQPVKSTSSDTVIDITLVKSTGAVAKIPDTQRKNDQTKKSSDRKKLARALLQEARRWRFGEEQGDSCKDQVAMVDVKPVDLATNEDASSEDRPEVYI